jgi:hypothetical protein
LLNFNGAYIKKGFRFLSEALLHLFWHTTSVLLSEEIKVMIEKTEPRCHVSWYSMGKDTFRFYKNNTPALFFKNHSKYGPYFE